MVGAGPAGSAAAFFCARAGLRCLLLEKSRFPRDKTCGDGIGAGGVAVLRAIGALDALTGRGAGLATGFGVQSPGGCAFRHTDIVFESPLRPEPLLIAPRMILDEVCARAAASAGAELREQARVRRLLRDGGRVVGVELDDGSILRARLVIGADGVHSAIARGLGQHNRDRAHTAFALRAYYRDLRRVDRDAFFVYDRRFMPAYFWIFPLPDGRANVGIGQFNRYLVDGSPSLKQLFERFVRENALVAELLSGGTVEGRLRGWPLRLGTGSGSGVADGALLVGDANGFIDPLTGEGIHFALRSGQLAAETAIAALARGDLSAAGLRDYERRWRAEFDDEFRYGNRALELLMTRPGAVDAVVDLARLDRGFAVLMGEVLCGVRSKRDFVAPGVLARIGLHYLKRRISARA
ncbi:MAG: geranylgeranyl reductase family protein [Deltaproteobacteria bacterium]|nr:geranylgeranyl reductase family protein [Deltaproteobacteria bacterium]